jgi:hypothetical protein
MRMPLRRWLRLNWPPQVSTRVRKSAISRFSGVAGFPSSHPGATRPSPRSLTAFRLCANSSWIAEPVDPRKARVAEPDQAVLGCKMKVSILVSFLPYFYAMYVGCEPQAAEPSNPTLCPKTCRPSSAGVSFHVQRCCPVKRHPGPTCRLGTVAPAGKPFQKATGCRCAQLFDPLFANRGGNPYFIDILLTKVRRRTNDRPPAVPTVSAIYSIERIVLQTHC